MQQGRPVPYDFRANRSSAAGGHDRHPGRAGGKVQENRQEQPAPVQITTGGRREALPTFQGKPDRSGNMFVLCLKRLAANLQSSCLMSNCYVMKSSAFT